MEKPADSALASLEGAQPSLDPRQRSNLKSTLIVLGCAIGQLTLVASATIFTLLPTIGKDLNIAQDQLQWPISAYSLTAGCFLLVLGRLADIYGRRRGFILGIAWFTIWAIACGFAQSLVQLALFRAFQGIGVAAATPAAIGILAEQFPPGRTRSIAFAAFSCGAPVGGSVGILVGGALTQLAPDSWRSVFFVFGAIAVLAGIAVFFAVPTDQIDRTIDRRVDWVGAAIVTVSVTFLLFVLAQGEVASNGWATPYIIVLLVLSIFGIVAFLIWEWYLENRTTFPPLMRLSLWKRANGRFAAVQAIAFVTWISFMCWLYWSNLMYQNYLQLSVIRTMIRYIPCFLSGITCNFIIAMIVGRVSGSILLAMGTAATGGACLIFALVNPHTAYWGMGFPAATIVVLGGDFTFATGSIFVAKIALPHEQSLAGGIFNTVMQIGGSLGIAITTVVADRVTKREARKLGIVYDSQTLSSIPPDALLRGYRAALWTAFAFAMFALALVLLFLRDIGKVGKPPIAEEPAVPGEKEDAAPSTLGDNSPEASVAPHTALEKHEP